MMREVGRSTPGAEKRRGLEILCTSSSQSPSTTPSSSPSPSHETQPTFLRPPSCLGRKSLTTLAALAQRSLLISLESPSRDKAHSWFLAWMSTKAQAAAARQVRGGRGERSRLREILSTSKEVAIISHDLAVETHLNDAGSSSSSSRTAMEAETIYSSDRMAHFRALTEFSSSSSSRDTARFSLVPGPGTHYFRYRGIWIRRLLDTIKLTTLYAFGHILPQLLEDARAMSEAANSGKTVIVTDVEAFMRSGKWYAERGVPYRRGGKTSLITALTGSHNLNLCLLSLSDRGMTDDKLLHLANAPERSILILEDIDVAFASRSSSEGGGGQEEEGKRPSTNSARRRRAAGLDPTTGLPPSSSSPSTSTASSSPSSSSSSYLAPTCSKLSSTGNEEDCCRTLLHAGMALRGRMGQRRGLLEMYQQPLRPTRRREGEVDSEATLRWQIIATGHGAETDTGTQPRDEAWREFQPRGIDGRAGMIWGTGAGPTTSTPTGRRARSAHPGPHNPTRAPPGLATDHPLHLCSRASRIGRGLKER
ncbi:hypothetical protein V8E36_001661 [Tilletia maclaganii]